MRLSEIDYGTTVAAYDPQTGEYHSLGAGYELADEARRAAEEVVTSDEYLLVAELAHINQTVDDETDMYGSGDC